MQRYVALDVGDRRIGVAVSDPLGITAQGVETYTRKNRDEDAAHILGLLTRFAPCRLLVGMPRNMDGTYGPQADKVRHFTAQLQRVWQGETVYWDERMTTVTAGRVLIDADVSRKKRKEVIDKLAAVVILQSYLDSGRGT